MIVIEYIKGSYIEEFALIGQIALPIWVQWAKVSSSIDQQSIANVSAHKSAWE